MKYEQGYRSSHVEDRRASGGRGGFGGSAVKIGGGLSLPVILLVVLFTVFTGDGGSDLGSVLGELAGGNQAPGPGSDAGDSGAPGQQPRGIEPSNDPEADQVAFISFVFDDVNTTWENIFTRSDVAYQWSTLVLYRGGTQTAGCGYGQATHGPFYCPADSKTYLDFSFFDTMRRQLAADGDFAQAYVIAHEVGHHVQNQLGVSSQVRQQQQANPDQANDLSVRLELQADCFAGVWAYSALDDESFEGGLVESGDLQEALDAAEAIGDDAIQGPNANPESFTHGTSQQRHDWFARGYDSGDPNSCNTFD